MSDVKEDPVNPRHYAGFGEDAAVMIIRRWTAVRKSLGLEPVSFDIGNALKYIQRAGLKDGQSEVQDLLKAVWYLQERIHVLDPSYPDPTK